MDRTEAIAKLPETYSEAMQLRDGHFDDEAIAHRLGITSEAVPQLFRLANDKLDYLLAENDDAVE